MFSIGVRKELNRIGTNHKFEPKFSPVIAKEIKIHSLTEAFGDETRQVAMNAAAHAGNAAVKAALAAHLNETTQTLGDYHLFKVFDILDLVTELNSPSNSKYITDMAAFGPNARIVLGIATVFDFDKTKTISDAGANLTLSVATPSGGSNEQMIKISGSSNFVGKLSDGTVFAYQYARICWDGSKKSPVIKDLAIDDRHADGRRNGGCPGGSFQDASKVPQ